MPAALSQSIHLIITVFFCNGKRDRNSEIQKYSACSTLSELVGVRRETSGKLENERYNPSLKLAMDITNAFEASVEEMIFLKKIMI